MSRDENPRRPDQTLLDGQAGARDGVRKKVGSNVVRARKRAGLSQEQLARLASLHRNEVGLVEVGKRIPRADTLIRLATALDVSVEELLDGINWILPEPTQAKGCFSIHRPDEGTSQPSSS